MGEVIPFGKPKKPKSPRPGGQDGKARYSGLQQTMADLIPGLKEEFSAMGVEISPTLEIEASLSGLRGVVSNDSIATARRNLRQMSIEDLREIARNSNEIQWKARPGYFRALVDEINSRS